MYLIDQDFYMSKIEQILSDAEFSKFASMRIKLAWLPNTKPDIVFEISQIAQISQGIYEKHTSKHFKRLKKRSNMYKTTKHPFVFLSLIATH